jgi:hypothetical protein
VSTLEIVAADAVISLEMANHRLYGRDVELAEIAVMKL